MTGSHTQRTLARLVAILLIATSACSDGTGPRRIEGEYVLRSVNGSGLPYTHAYPSTSSSYTIRSERITIESGASWTSSKSHVYVFSQLTRDETNDLDGGTYTYDASRGALLLLSTSMIMEQGTIAGRTLTLQREGDVYRYER